MKRVIIAVVVLCSVIGTVGLLFWWRHTSLKPSEQTYAVYLREVETVPVVSAQPSATSSAKASDLAITAQAAYIADVSSGAVLYKKNEHIQRAPASTTKLLTALVALETYSLDDILQVTSEATTEGNTVGLYFGEEITVQNLLKAMLISSGNDAAYVLANNYPGGLDAFVERMNSFSQEIGMQSSHFENPAGFDGDTHYSSAYDLYVLSLEAMKSEFIRNIVATTQTEITNSEGTVTHFLQTTNQLLLENPWVVGIKTGTTEKAGQVLISQYETSGTGTIIVVMMGSEDRFKDTKALAEWVYSRYQWKLFSNLE